MILLFFNEAGPPPPVLPPLRTLLGVGATFLLLIAEVIT